MHAWLYQLLGVIGRLEECVHGALPQGHSVFAIIVRYYYIYTFPKLTTVKTFHARLPFRNSIVLPSHVVAPFTCSDAAASGNC